MKWKQGKPTKAGIYLRKNPAANQIVRQEIVAIDGVLNVIHSEGGLVKLDAWKGSHSFWWYGPIPKAPEEDN